MEDQFFPSRGTYGLAPVAPPDDELFLREALCNGTFKLLHGGEGRSGIGWGQVGCGIEQHGEGTTGTGMGIYSSGRSRQAEPTVSRKPSTYRGSRFGSAALPPLNLPGRT